MQSTLRTTYMMQQEKEKQQASKQATQSKDAERI